MPQRRCLHCDLTLRQSQALIAAMTPGHDRCRFSAVFTAWPASLPQLPGLALHRVGQMHNAQLSLIIHYLLNDGGNMNRKLSAVTRKVPEIEEERAISPRELKLLAEPTREFIFNALVAEARTATELAQLLECPTTRLYHHLKLLEKHALIVVVAERLVSGILERRYRAVARRLRLDRGVFGDDVLGNERLEAILSYNFDQARSDIVRSHAAGLIDLGVKPPASNALMAYRHVLKLSSADRERLLQRLHEFYQEYERLSQQPPPEQGEFVGLLLATYPTEMRAADLPKARGTQAFGHRRKHTR
jgi:DNA-binding transcriptional ArsR family regulator